MTHKGQKLWDVVVIGGGPAGMLAAAEAGKRGKSVLVLEKNKTLGKKLLITGGGRCNVTNRKPNVRALLAKYKKADKFLFSAFAQYDVEKTLDFFHARGMQTKEELEGRIFPLTNRAQSVWDTLTAYMKESTVTIQTNAKVLQVICAPAGDLQNSTSNIFSITLADKTVLQARSCVVATGGTSRPETGSTGDGYAWMKKLGHTIHENDFALVPIALTDAWVKKLGGVTLTDVGIAVFQNNQKQMSQKGKILFTHFGISGPTILNMSRGIGELLNYGEVEIRLDLFPTLDQGAVKKLLQSALIENSNKKIKNTLSLLIPKAIVPGILELAGIDGDTPNNNVRTDERTRIAAQCKAISLSVKELLGADKAIVTSGGVPPEEIDFKTMESRQVKGLYIIGDMIDIDRPSGGYSLQLCWTSGFVAGMHC